MSLTINGREVGAGRPVYVVAELSANHAQRLSKALELVEAAARCGADAVKLQTYTPDTMTLDLDSEPFRVRGTLWDGYTLYELYREAATPWEWHAELAGAARDRGLDLFSTAFDASSVDFLEDLNVPVHKVASFEMVDHALIRRVAATGKPLILSTGMATLDEIAKAVAVAREGGCAELALLRCVSAYPSPPEEMNLRTIPHLRERFGAEVGLSDHTLGTAVPVAAVALGASIVEKHLTLDRSVPGPDSAFSLEPPEFRRMVNAVRVSEKALGEAAYGPTAAQQPSLRFRRSLFAVRDIEAGEELTGLNVRSIRPGLGLAPKHLPQVLGRRAARRIVRGTPLAWQDVEGGEPLGQD